MSKHESRDKSARANREGLGWRALEVAWNDIVVNRVLKGAVVNSPIALCVVRLGQLRKGIRAHNLTELDRDTAARHIY